MKAKIKNRLLLLLLLPALAFASCITEQEKTGRPDAQSGEYTFMLNVPGSNMGTRALSEADEYIVSEVDVLVFNNATGRFLYHAAAKSLIETLPTAPTEDRKVRFTTTLVKETGVTAYDFVILANSRESVLSALPSLSASSTKADAQAAIVSSVTAGTGWIADASNAAFRPFPMWGEIVNKAISPAENYTASLLRAVAKIDLSVNLGASHAPTDEFVINQVKFYNYSSKGFVIPNQAPANLGTNAKGQPKVLNVASVPTGALSVGASNSIDYTSKIPASGPDAGKLVREIYTFEAPAGSLSDYTNNICIVFQGTLTKGGVSATGWYRLDFVNRAQDLTATYMDIKRNHHYRVVVNSVGDYGYDTEEEAYNSLPVNIVGEVIEWEQGDNPHGQTEGQYTLSVSRLEYEFNREEIITDLDHNTLNIRTDHVSGWTATVYEDEEGSIPADSDFWLTLSQESSATGDLTTGHNIYLYVEENAGAERTAWVFVRAGRMLYKIKVTQTTDITRYYFGRGDNLGWAKTNIYVQTGDHPDTPEIESWYFTFGEYHNSNTSPTTTERPQGVYFKWGSLVGISPVGNWVNNSTRIFTPKDYMNGTATTANSWTNMTAMPIVTPEANTEPTLHQLYQAHDPSQGIGDICRYITEKGWAPPGKWRMPTAEECQINNYQTNFLNPTARTSNSIYGLFDLNTGVTIYRDISDNRTWFVLSGTRTNYLSIGDLFGVGESGRYWTATPHWITPGWASVLAVDGNGAVVGYNGTINVANSVRCVLEEW